MWPASVRGAPRGSPVEGPRAVRQQDPEGLRRGWREAQSGIQVLVLRIIRAPVTRVVDANERERRTPMLNDVRAISDEHLPRIAHTLDHCVLTRVAVVIAEHAHHTKRRVEIAERPHIVGNELLGDVDHVSRLHDEIGFQPVGVRDDRRHLLARHVNPGMHVGEVRDPQAVEPRRQIVEHQRSSRDGGQSLRAPDAVG